ALVNRHDDAAVAAHCSLRPRVGGVMGAEPLPRNVPAALKTARQIEQADTRVVAQPQQAPPVAGHLEVRCRAAGSPRHSAWPSRPQVPALSRPAALLWAVDHRPISLDGQQSLPVAPEAGAGTRREAGAGLQPGAAPQVPALQLMRWLDGPAPGQSRDLA